MLVKIRCYKKERKETNLSPKRCRPSLGPFSPYPTRHPCVQELAMVVVGGGDAGGCCQPVDGGDTAGDTMFKR